MHTNTLAIEVIDMICVLTVSVVQSRYLRLHFARSNIAHCLHFKIAESAYEILPGDLGDGTLSGWQLIADPRISVRADIADSSDPQFGGGMASSWSEAKLSGGNRRLMP